MFRKKAAAKKKQHDYIRRRGQEVTRIEAFSDAVIAFAITLLIVSLEVPHDFHELISKMLLFIPFGFSFLIVFSIWYQQNIFFRRFGMHDPLTIALNGVLLFIVLVYMFPLKFLFSIMFSREFHLEPGQMSTLFCLYCGGFCCFYLLFAWMYYHAYRQRDKLHLTDIEAFQTKTHIYNYLVVASASCLGFFIASFGDIMVGPAGMSFSLIGVFSYLLHKKRGKLFKQRFGDIEAVVNEHMHAHTIADDDLN
jgi:uncharacterized membrane protein